VNSTRAEKIGRDQRDLNAYHDGELSGLRSWIFERRLARSPALLADLEALKQLSRRVQGMGAQPPSVDVWDEIAIQLPAIDAQFEGQRQRRDGQRQRGGEQREWLGMDWLAAYARPLVAVAASVALALALFLGIMEDSAPQIPGVIRWLDTGGRSVIVLEDQDDATIVWLLDAPEDGASEGGSREAV
jgi:anti-sigma factor RsiW